jgi:hypothetical protein
MLADLSDERTQHQHPCDELITLVKEATEKVRSGEITPGVAQAIARTAGEACRLGRAKTLYAVARGEKPNIPFFN